VASAISGQSVMVERCVQRTISDDVADHQSSLSVAEEGICVV